MDKAQLTPALARCLIGRSFPAWSGLAIRPVALDGWDNTTFRLGDELSIRLPSAEGYVPQVAKEHRWLPVLAPALPLSIPQPVALGEPGCGFPRPWSVYRWIEGEPAASARIDDLDAFAADLARFLRTLGRVDASGGPAAGDHSFGRGGPLERYDPETRAAIGALGSRIDGRAALRAWESALDQPWTRPPVWLHGDVAASNLLVRDGRLAAVIDFGCCAVGDPACDTVMAWTFFTGTAATTFLETLDLDRGTRARGRAWALWKALITVRQDPDDAAALAAVAHRVGWRLAPLELIELLLSDVAD